MAASIGVIDVRILIFELVLLSYFISDFDRFFFGRLHDLIRACMSDSHAVKVAVSFKLNLYQLDKSFTDIRVIG